MISEITEYRQGNKDAQCSREWTPPERTREGLLSKGTNVQRASLKNGKTLVGKDRVSSPKYLLTHRDGQWDHLFEKMEYY